ncbi:MAG: DUF1320 domain-containing protein [Burkholderiales bacterium]|nr:DUF1320 domain-containing protein [Burkholderiales bacterium]
MPYCTQQDLIDEFGELEMIQLTDRAVPPAGTIDTVVLDRAIARADAEIDTYLAGRHRLPLASVPRVLVGWACDLTRFYLYGNGAPDIVTDRHKGVMRSLEHIALGKLSLGLDVDQAPVPTGDAVQFEGGQRVFARESLDAE